jgi:integrase
MVRRARPLRPAGRSRRGGGVHRGRGRRGVRCSTLGRRIAGTPTDDERVKAVVRGARRTLGVKPVKKAAATSDKVLAMVAGGRDLVGKRDRALLLLGFALAARRSELVALDVADLQETDDGFRVPLRWSKTDQEGHGETIAIVRGRHACPVKAVKAWLSAAGITAGPLFRPVAKGGRLSNQRLTDKSVCDIVKAYAGRLGLKAAEFGAHSLRAGFLTSAARRGASVFKMRDVSRHKSMDVLQAYVRDADVFKDHAGIGLL